MAEHLVVVKTEAPSFDNWLKEGIYMLELYNPADITKCRFFTFPIPPQNLTAEDTFAVEIIPTQDRIYTEHQGILVYTISISGTFGVLPTSTARAGAVLCTPFYSPEFVARETGYAQVHRLRELLRTYAKQRVTEPNAEDIKLYFINTKDGEYYEVEPVTFRIERNARRPVAYDYYLVLQAKKPADRELPVKEPWWKRAWRIFNQVLNTVDALMNAATMLRAGIVNTGLYAMKIAGEVSSIANGISNVAGIYATILRTGRRMSASFKDVKETWQSIDDKTKAELREKFGFPADPHNRLPVLPVPLSAAEKKVLEFVNKVADLASTDLDKLKYAEVIDSANKFVANLRRIKGTGLLEGDSETPTFTFEDGDVASRWTGTPSEAYNAEFGNPPPFSAVREVVVSSTDNIYSIAQRELGDWRYWKLLVELNSLKYPYIWRYPMPGVKAPGDKLFIPEFGTAEIEVYLPKKTTLSVAREDIELGIDLYTENDDLVVNIRKDLALAVGITALKQAILRRLETPVGSIFLHPGFGSMSVSSKANILLARIFRILATSIVADRRVEGITGMSTELDGNKVILRLGLKLRQVPDILSVETAIE